MRRKKEAFDGVGAQVVLVGLGTVEETASFKKRFDVPFAMIADPEKRLFEAFRLKRAATGALFSAKVFFSGMKTMAKGHGLGVPQGDVRQLPGVFIVDTAGRIIFSHHASDPSDHPLPETLLDVLRNHAPA